MGIIFNNINRGSFPNNIIFSSLENNAVDIVQRKYGKNVIVTLTLHL